VIGPPLLGTRRRRRRDARGGEHGQQAHQERRQAVQHHHRVDIGPYDHPAEPDDPVRVQRSAVGWWPWLVFESPAYGRG
jgi:hypothetical protein